MEGESAVLEVQATGKPQPTPKWLMANEEIIASDEFIIENHTDGTSVLTIMNPQPEKLDKITFEAVSPVGVAKTTTKIQIEGILSRDFSLNYYWFNIWNENANLPFFMNLQKFIFFSAFSKNEFFL